VECDTESDDDAIGWRAYLVGENAADDRARFDKRRVSAVVRRSRPMV
jgi:hypothetical protein